MEERLQKILAHADYGSRRSCEELIRQGRVRVNDRVAELGQKADPDRDHITVDGKPVHVDDHATYVALHKPPGILSHAGDGSGRHTTVLDLVPLPGHLFPVGRLDLESEGLVLLTDDGDLTYRLTHPKFGHEKEYEVLVEGHPTDRVLQKWRRGVFLAGRTTAPAQVQVLRKEGSRSWLRVLMQEGRKRQIRRVAAMLGHPVQRLIRVRIGPIPLGDLATGQWRRLSPAEVEALKAHTRRGKK